MTDPTVTDHVGDLLGDAWASFAAATKTTAQDTPPAERWALLQLILTEAGGLVRALADGRADYPELQPCPECGVLSPSPAKPELEQKPVDKQAGDEDETFVRRQRDREGGRKFTVDEGVELRHWTNAVRSIDGYKDATDEQCASALAAWHTHVQPLDEPLRFVSWPGYTGVLLYELLAARHGAMVQPVPLESELVKEITASSRTLRMWSFINPEAELKPGDVVTELDVTAQFLAAAGSTECGDGEPKILDNVDPDWLPKLITVPGYVELTGKPDLSTLSAAARYSFAKLDTGWRLPTPALKYLVKDRDVVVPIGRAVVWPSGDKNRGRPAQYGRRLAVWATEVRTARLALTHAARAGEPGAGIALAVLKRMYAAFLGGVLKSEKTNDRGTLRHDWADMVVATAGVNALRAIDKAGAIPFGGMKDSFWFASPVTDAPFRPDGLQYSDQPGEHFDKPGKWHLNRWGEITDNLIRHHADGRIGLVRNDVIAANKARKAAD